jgi:capsular exopolysaccharide synthesis family protein
MSHIFDALQRSEAERSGTETSTFSLATELLQAAEEKMHAVAVATPERPAALPPGFQELLQQQQGRQPGPQEELSPLEQCRSLPVSISPNSRLVSVAKEESLAAEKFRFLAVRLRQMRQNRPLKKVLITSTIPQEGKSTVAANLACTLARKKQQKTLLLEGDLRRPTVAENFGLGNVPGLCEWLQGETTSTNIYRLESLGLWVLPAGRAPQNPLELMQSGKLSLLMDQLCGWFDWIVIDSPPVLPLADTSIWGRLSDGIVLVTRKGTTEKQQLQRGLEALEQSKLLGALVNGSTDTAHSDYYQRYGPPASSPDSPQFRE